MTLRAGVHRRRRTARRPQVCGSPSDAIASNCPTKAKYLRLSWAQGRAPLGSAVRIDRANACSRRRADGSGRGRSVAEHEATTGDLKGAFPIDRVGIDLPENNSVVPAQIYVRATAQDWRPVATLVVYRLRRADAAEVASSPAVNAGGNALLDAARRSQFRRPQAGRPRIRAGWLPQELVFAARGGAVHDRVRQFDGHVGALPIATLVWCTTSAPPTAHRAGRRLDAAGG
jgi:hypothetical protein